MSNKKNKLKDLFIEELGQVQGGKAATTLAIGEESPNPTTWWFFEEDVQTTLALGEEDADS